MTSTTKTTDGKREAMRLPEGKTCIDCIYFERTCKWLLSRNGNEKDCDWSPSRFADCQACELHADFNKHAWRYANR